MLTIIQPSHNLLHQLHHVRPVYYLLQHTQCGLMSYPLLCFYILVYIQHIQLEQKDLIP
jgi:hypothetical protein